MVHKIIKHYQCMLNHRSLQVNRFFLIIMHMFLLSIFLIAVPMSGSVFYHYHSFRKVSSSSKSSPSTNHPIKCPCPECAYIGWSNNMISHLLSCSIHSEKKTVDVHSYQIADDEKKLVGEYLKIKRRNKRKTYTR